MSKDNQIVWHMKQTMQKMETELKGYGRALDMRANQVGALCAALEKLLGLVELTNEQEEGLKHQIEAYRRTLPQEPENATH